MDWLKRMFGGEDEEQQENPLPKNVRPIEDAERMVQQDPSLAPMFEQTYGRKPRFQPPANVMPVEQAEQMVRLDPKPKLVEQFRATYGRDPHLDNTPREQEPPAVVEQPAPEEEPGITEKLGALKETIPASFKASIAGLGEASLDMQPEDYLPPQLQLLSRGYRQAKAQLTGKSPDEPLRYGDVFDFLAPGAADEMRARSHEVTQEAERVIQQANEDLSIDPGEPMYYVNGVLQAVAEMTPSVAATVVTRNPRLGAALMGSQVFGREYSGAIESGRTQDEAFRDALFYAGIETITEKIPLDFITRYGKKAFSGVLAAGAAEGVQEAVTEALSIGYEAGVLDEDVFTDPETGEFSLIPALKRLRDAGIIGAGSGALMRGGVETVRGTAKGVADSLERRAERQKTAQTEQILRNFSEADLQTIPEYQRALAQGMEPPQALRYLAKLPEIQRVALTGAETLLAEAAETGPVDMDSVIDRIASAEPVTPAEASVAVKQGYAKWYGDNIVLLPAGKRMRAQREEDRRRQEQQVQADLAQMQQQAMPQDQIEISQQGAAAAAEAGEFQPTVATGAIDAAAAEAATSPENDLPEPTDAQKEAGNYRKGHLTLHGLDVSIENPAGTSRRPEWPPLANHYGYIRRTEAADGEQLDAFLGPQAEDPSKPVFVVDQIAPETGAFDEQKALLGWDTPEAAAEGYRANYSKDWQGLGGLVQFDTLEQFKDWTRNADGSRPAAETAPAFGARVMQVSAPTSEPEKINTAEIDTSASESINPAKTDTSDSSLNRTASWVIRNKETGEVVMETFDRKKVDALNTAKYEAVSIYDHLVSLNKKPTVTEQAQPEEYRVIEREDALGNVEAEIRQRNPRTNRWDKAATLPDVGDVSPWFESRGLVAPEPERQVWNAKEKKFVRAKKAESVNPFTDRRQNTADRARVASLPKDERDVEIERLRTRTAELEKKAFTEPMTGLKNRAAWEERDPKPAVAIADVDGLKWVNDNLGYESGDKLLKAIGEALGAQSGLAYRIGGDEFALEADTPEELQRLMDAATAALGGAEIDFLTPDGNTVTYAGLDISYGIGGDPNEAESRLKESRKEREASGEYRRGAKPRGLREDAAARQQDQVDPVAEDDVTPRFSRAPQTNSPAFKRWFGDSKVVDKNGQPLVVYHGGKAGIDTFKGGDGSQFVAFFTADRGTAEGYRTYNHEYDDSAVHEVFLALQNPLDLTNPTQSTVEKIRELVGDNPKIKDVNESEHRVLKSHSIVASIASVQDELFEAARERGFDGVMMLDTGVRGTGIHTSFVAFRPEQIKSAIGNRGTFDPKNPNILFSRATAEPDAALIEEAKKRFGTTLLPKEAGYVMPDGSMLDFTGRHYSQDHPSLRNQRSVDHRELAGEDLETGEEWDLVPDSDGSSDGMLKFMDRAHAIRVDFNANVLSAVHKPTPQQLDTLDNVLRNKSSDISYVRPDNGEIADEISLEITTRPQIEKFFDQAEGKKGSGVLFQKVFHGTPHRFDKFSLEAIGTGEGAQAYGWGLYFAGKREIAEYYRDALRKKELFIEGERIGKLDHSSYADTQKTISKAAQKLFPHSRRKRSGAEGALNRLHHGGDWERAEKGIDDYVDKDYRDVIREVFDEVKAKVSVKDVGNLIQAEIPEDSELLDWDAPLIEQPEEVLKKLAKIGITAPPEPPPIKDAKIRAIVNAALKQDQAENVELMVDNDRRLYDMALEHARKAGKDIDELLEESGAGEYVTSLAREHLDALIARNNYTGERAYRDLVESEGSDKAASLALNAAGIPGLRYFDASSRSVGEGTRNYVIWDDSKVTVEAVNDELRQAKALLRRGTPATDPPQTQRTRRLINTIATQFAGRPYVQTVNSWRDLPDSVQQFIADAHEGAATKGVYVGGTQPHIYLVAENLQDERDATETLIHEMIGHYGVRSVLGESELFEMADQIAAAQPGKIREAIQRNGLDKMGLAPDVMKRIAAEEVIAYAAQDIIAGKTTLANLHAKVRFWVERVMAAIRRMLGLADPKFAKEATDAEIIRLIARAYDFVRTGRAARTARMGYALRSVNVPPFYSQLVKTINDKLPERAPPAEYLKQIQGQLGKDGLKPEEFKWSGLEDVLSDMRVRDLNPTDWPSDLKEHVEKNWPGASLESVRLAALKENDPELRKAPQLKAMLNEPVHKISKAQLVDLVDRNLPRIVPKTPLQLTRAGQNALQSEEMFDDDELQREMAEQQARDGDFFYPDEGDDETAPNRWELKNYVVVRKTERDDDVEEDEDEIEYEVIRKSDNEVFETQGADNVNDLIQNLANYRQKLLDGIENDPEKRTNWLERMTPGGDPETYEEHLYVWENNPGERFTYSSHWNDAANVLLHVRSDYNRETPDGAKLHYIDELQSDWHQEARERGFVATEEDKKRAEEKVREETKKFYAEHQKRFPKLTAAAKALKAEYDRVRETLVAEAYGSTPRARPGSGIAVAMLARDALSMFNREASPEERAAAFDRYAEYMRSLRRVEFGREAGMQAAVEQSVGIRVETEVHILHRAINSFLLADKKGKFSEWLKDQRSDMPQEVSKYIEGAVNVGFSDIEAKDIWQQFTEKGDAFTGLTTRMTAQGWHGPLFGPLTDAHTAPFDLTAYILTPEEKVQQILESGGRNRAPSTATTGHLADLTALKATLGVIIDSGKRAGMLPDDYTIGNTDDLKSVEFGNWNEEKPSANPQYRLDLDEAIDNYAQAMSGGIPFAPMAQSYQLVALKHQLQLAVQEGMDEIAIATGQRHAHRWGALASTETAAISKKTVHGKPGYLIESGVEDFSVADEDLVAAFGKEAADAIRKEFAKDDSSFHYDFTIGPALLIPRSQMGRGLLEAYNSVQPKMFNKFLKRYGMKFELGEMKTEVEDPLSEMREHGNLGGMMPVVPVWRAKITPAAREAATKHGFPLFQKQQPQTQTEAFREWFGDSKVVDANGEPLVVYHGTAIEKTAFRREGGAAGVGAYFTDSREVADDYAEMDASIDGDDPITMEVYLSIQNPYMVEDVLETQAITAERRDELEAQGYDGVIATYPDGTREFVAFRPEQIKSATGNRGTFDRRSPNILFAKADKKTTDIVAGFRAKRQGAAEKTLPELVKEWTQDWKARLNQYFFDDFYGLKRAEVDVAQLPKEQWSYVSARLARGVDDVLRTTLEYGAPIWDSTDVATRAPTYDRASKPFFEILAPLRDAELLEMWKDYVVAYRAKRLKAEDRENLFTSEEIETILKLSEEYPLLEQIRVEYAALNKKILDFAQAAGVINPETRALWENQDYVPFYRVIDDAGRGKVNGPFTGTGRLANLGKVIKTLRGGRNNMGDPVDNIIMNWSALLRAALNNHAGLLAVDNLTGTGLVTKARQVDFKKALVSREEVARRLKAEGAKLDDASLDGFMELFVMTPPAGENILNVFRNGKREYWEIHDPLLFRAMTAIGKAPFGPWMNIFRIPKRVLTQLITLSPEFSIRNWFRDALSSFILRRDTKSIPFWDGAKGFVKTLKKHDDFKEMMAGGATFESGYVTAHDPGAVQKVIRARMRNAGFRNSIIDKPMKFFEMYRDVTSSMENANRVPIYRDTLKQTGSRKLALYEAKDIMDFHRRGDGMVIRFLAESVAFFNPRLQGLDRIPRTWTEAATKGQRAKLASAVLVRGTMLMLPALILYLRNRQLKCYQDLPNYDKDLYFHFFVGDASQGCENMRHYRLPKPFEMGALFATVPERMLEAALSKEPDAGKQLADRLLWIFGEMLNMNPTPTTLEPMLELGLNKDFFRDAPVLNMHDQKLLPEMQYDYRTPPTYRFISQYAAAAPGAPDWLKSPKQLEHLVSGWGGTLFNDYAILATDAIVRVAQDYPPPPAKRLDEIPFVKSFAREHPLKYTAHMDAMYGIYEEVSKYAETAKEIEDQIALMDAAGNESMSARLQAQLDWLERTKEPELIAAGELNAAIKEIGGINEEIMMTTLDAEMSPKEKRKEIDALYEQRNEIAEEAIQFRPGGPENPREEEDDEKEEPEAIMDRISGMTRKQQVDALNAAGLPQTAMLVDSLPTQLPRRLQEELEKAKGA